VAYQHLLDWHFKQYILNNPEKWAKGKNPRLRVNSTGDWKLTINERKRILLEHIYGVDIDSQAVEVTKLSLLLKVLEGENEETMQGQLFHERALPDLGQNIKCGNSLVGSDIYKDTQSDLFNDEEMIRVNAFDWEKEFSDIFKNGGFDAVIGNPPYVRQETLGEQFKTYAKTHYKTFAGTADLYTYFIEKGVSLIRENGYFSYIVANKWMRANYGKPLRTWLKQQCIEEITDFGDLPVFENATTYPCIIRIGKAKPNPEFKVANIATLDFSNLNDFVKGVSFSLKKTSLEDNGWALVNQENQNLLEKLKQSGMTLGKYVDGKIYFGIKTGLNEAFVIDSDTRKRFLAEDANSAEVIKPFLAGREIKKHKQPSPNKYLILIPKGWTDSNRGAVKSWEYFSLKYPSIAKHLSQFEEKAKLRCDKGNYWWELRECKYYTEFENPKILLPDIALECNCMLDEKGGVYCANTAYIIPGCDKYLVGVMNSKIVTYIYKNISSTYRGGYLRFWTQFLEQIPIPPAPKPDTLTPLAACRTLTITS
jgi:hypothetical protein